MRQCIYTFSALQVLDILVFAFCLGYLAHIIVSARKRERDD